MFSAIGFGIVLSAFRENYVVYGLFANPGSLPGVTVVSWLGSWIPLVALIRGTNGNARLSRRKREGVGKRIAPLVRSSPSNLSRCGSGASRKRPGGQHEHR